MIWTSRLRTTSSALRVKYERDEELNYLVSERPSGKFARVLKMPDRLDAAKVEAEIKDGVLHLIVPKSEEALPKVIKVKSSKK
jgi:HSP20 family protein